MNKKTYNLTYDLPNIKGQADTKFNLRFHAMAGVPPILN